LKSWNQQPFDGKQCKEVGSRVYQEADIKALDRERVLDAAGAYDPVLATLNRRVELWPKFATGGGCSIESLERAPFRRALNVLIYDMP
jgi:hypothetical protein